MKITRCDEGNDRKVELYGLTVEHMDASMGVSVLNPRFGWKIRSNGYDVRQLSWRIKAFSGEECIWNTGIVKTEENKNHRYAGRTLKSFEMIVWKLQVETTEGWLEAESSFEMGILNREEWKAQWIVPKTCFGENGMPMAPYLRRRFQVKEGLVSARVYQTARGIYRYWMNGEECTEKRFAPGNTSYYKRMQYQTEDITPYLHPGENVWAVCIGDGWWRGACGSFSVRNNYGKDVEFFGELVLNYADGSQEIVPTDTNFVYNYGGLLQTDMKLGTIFDARKEPGNWRQIGFDDSEWKTPKLSRTEEPECLIGEEAPSVKEQERFPGTVFSDANGDCIVDFAQNIAGYVQMKFRDCKAGQRITIEHGEGLRAGRFDNSNIFIRETSLHEMFQEVVYYAKGEQEETFTAEFSMMGFRYIRIRGYERKILPGDFTAIAVYSDLPVTGQFECSNSLLNKLFQNALWSQKGNFLDVPTDCPTRERSAYTGDAQVYCKTASWMMDVYPFFEKWMQELNAEQAVDGQVPTIMPAISFHSMACCDEFMKELDQIDRPELGFMKAALGDSEMGKPQMLDGSAGWGDAAVIIPYTMYQVYDDKSILENQYESAKKWVDYMIRHASRENLLYVSEPYYQQERNGKKAADYIWDTDFHWGEWSEPAFVERTLPANFMEEKIKHGEPAVASAYLCYSSRLLAEMAQILGKVKDENYYRQYSDRATEVYETYLINEDGTVKFTEKERQAPYVRILAFGLCKDEKKKKAVKEQLKAAVKNADYHLNTGFLSTAMLLNVLTEMGESQIAYRILEQESAPSWLYPIVNGHTTILESWDGVQKYFGSFNHYSFGAVCDYLFQYICGIQSDAKSPGFKHFQLRPFPGGNLNYASASYESCWGQIRMAWEKEDGKLKYKFTIPAGTTAEILLPKGTTCSLGSGSYQIEE